MKDSLEEQIDCIKLIEIISETVFIIVIFIDQSIFLVHFLFSGLVE